MGVETGFVCSTSRGLQKRGEFDKGDKPRGVLFEAPQPTKFNLMTFYEPYICPTLNILNSAWDSRAN